MQIKNIGQSQNGFTLLELLIATTVFSTILLLCTYGLIQIGNTFYKGSTAVRTQNINRGAIDNISQAIQYGGRGVLTNAVDTMTGPAREIVATTQSNGVFCTGNVRYRFNRNTRVQGTNWALLMDELPTGGGCVFDFSKGSARELLGENMRIVDLAITEKDDESFDINLSVAYGDDDQLTAGKCNPGAGSQFCATSTFNTSVQRRIQ